MLSNRKAEIARINGAKSRGPVSPQGKARSAQNSTQHGLTARNPCLATDDSEQYEQLRQTHIDHFQPNTTYQLDLIDQFASIAWRIRRAESIETALLDQEIDIRKPDIEKAFQSIDREGLWAIGFKSLGEHCNAINNLDRQYKRLVSPYKKVKLTNEPTVGPVPDQPTAVADEPSC